VQKLCPHDVITLVSHDAAATSRPHIPQPWASPSSAGLFIRTTSYNALLLKVQEKS
jgi:hypothetical protein